MKDSDIAESLIAEMIGAKQQVGRRWSIEAETAFALGVVRNKCECRIRGARARNVLGADTLVLQTIEQKIAKAIIAQHAGKARFAAEAGDGYRDVSGRAAGKRHELLRESALIVAPRMKVNQRLTKTENGLHGLEFLELKKSGRKDEAKKSEAPQRLALTDHLLDGANLGAADTVEQDVQVAQQWQEECVLQTDVVGKYTLHIRD